MPYTDLGGLWLFRRFFFFLTSLLSLVATDIYFQNTKISHQQCASKIFSNFDLIVYIIIQMNVRISNPICPHMFEPMVHILMVDSGLKHVKYYHNIEKSVNSD